jgi:AcrR family transcriptional regulator
MEPKEKILRTATQLFARKSYASVGIREIAQTAEVNSAMISYYFGGKHGILREIYGVFVESYRQVFYQALEHTRSFEGFYRDFLRRIILDFRDKAPIYVVCISEFGTDIPEVQDIKVKFTEEADILLANIAVKFQVDMSSLDFLKEAFGPIAILNSVLGMLIFKVATDPEQVLNADKTFYEGYAAVMTELFLYGVMGVLESGRV